MEVSQYEVRGAQRIYSIFDALNRDGTIDEESLKQFPTDHYRDPMKNAHELLLSPASVVKQIASYKFSLFGRLDSRGPIVLYDPNGDRIAHVFFEREGNSLPKPQVLPDGIIYIYFYYTDFPLVVDLLRHEADRILVFVDENNCRISSGI